jgi:large subunit ribosomal protein L22
MEARCVAKYIRVTPRKMRLVANLVRGKSVNEAIGILRFTPRSGSSPILKAVQSAVANIVNRDDAHEVNPDALVVKTIFVDEGPTYKRFLPRAMGRATPIRKRMSHVTVAVALPELPAAEEGAEVTAEGQEAAPKKIKTVRKPAAKAASKKTAPAKKTNATRSAKKKTV